MSKRRREWDEAMSLAGHEKPKDTRNNRRNTGRQSVMSKSMRVVDEETRNEVRDARLAALEADNHIEEVGDAQDEDYVDSEEEDRLGKKKTRRKRGAKDKGSVSRVISKMRIKSLAQLMMEGDYDPSGASGPNVVSVSMGPSRYPRRRFCTVCGLWGTLSCRRCGQRYCSKKCEEHHKEFRCSKFTL